MRNILPFIRKPKDTVRTITWEMLKKALDKIDEDERREEPEHKEGA